MESVLVLVVPYGAGTNSRGRVGAGWGPDLSSCIPYGEPAPIVGSRLNESESSTPCPEFYDTTTKVAAFGDWRRQVTISSTGRIVVIVGPDLVDAPGYRPHAKSVLIGRLENLPTSSAVQRTGMKAITAVLVGILSKPSSAQNTLQRFLR